MKKIFSLLFSLVFLLSFVSADALITFNVLNATIDGGNQINGNSPVSDFDVIGYTCANSACTQIGTKLNSLSKHSSSSSVQLSFPTTLLSSYGYLLYFYKDGYIGYEEYSITYSGAGIASYPNPIYLAKKKFGEAKIVELEETNFNSNLNNVNISNGTSLNFEYKVVSNGTKYSGSYDAILDTRHSDVPLQEKTNVNSWFIITNSSATVHQEKETNQMEYSGQISKQFDYKFDNAGIYNITIISEIADEKIINQINSSYSFLVNVYLNESATNPTNQTNSTNQTTSNESFYAVSNITYLTYSNLSSNFSFNLKQFSKKTNQSGEFNVSSNLTIKVINYDKNTTLDVLSYLLNETTNTFNFSRNFNSNGNYTLNFVVCPLLTGNISCSEKNISFEVKTNDDSDDDDDDDSDSCNKCKKSKTSSYYDDSVTSRTVYSEEDYSNNSIYLRANTKTDASVEYLYYIILFTLILSLIVVSVIILLVAKQDL